MTQEFIYYIFHEVNNVKTWVIDILQVCRHPTYICHPFSLWFSKQAVVWSHISGRSEE